MCFIDFELTQTRTSGPEEVRVVSQSYD